MKKLTLSSLLAIGVASSFLISCSKSNDGGGTSELKVDKTEVTVSTTEAAKVQITTDAEGTWNARTTSAWLTLSPTSGTGPGTLTITCTDPGYRETNTEPVVVYLSGKIGTQSFYSQIKVTLPTPSNQAPLATTEAVYPLDGATNVDQELRFAWKEAVDPDGDKLTYILEYSTDKQNWTTIKRSTQGNTDGIKSTGYADGTTLQANTTYYWRVTSWDMFDAKSEPSQIFSFTTCDAAEGTWQDGEARLYQNNSNGSDKAFTLIVTGDGFTAEDMAPGGAWETLSTRAIEGLFNYVEPYKTYRPYLRVWRVAAVSNERGASTKTGGTTTPCDRIVDTKFGTMYDTGNSAWCGLYDDPYPGQPGKTLNDLWSFVSEALPEGATETANNAGCAVVCIMNAGIYKGLVNYYTGTKRTIGFVCASNGAAGSMTGYENVFVHEIGGHAIGHLADCYISSGGTLSEAKKTQTLEWQALGWYQNVDVTGQKETCPWNFFFTAPEYSSYYNVVGMYEGARSTAKGIWRSEDISCMQDNRFYFDAPSRYSIVKQLKAAAGEEMNWQDFVNKDYDRNNANTGTRATFIPYDFVPLPEPVMIHD